MSYVVNDYDILYATVPRYIITRTYNNSTYVTIFHIKSTYRNSMAHCLSYNIYFNCVEGSLI